MRTNRPIQSVNQVTAEGGIAARITPEQSLRRLCLTCLLWEDGFYVDGKGVANAIIEASKKCPIETVIKTAVECKEKGYLRHVPLHLGIEVLKRRKEIDSSKSPGYLRGFIRRLIVRADEISELVSMYWKGGVKAFPKQMKLALRDCFHKFDEYQFAKWDKDSQVKIRDVLLLVRPKPKDEEQSALFKRIIERKMKTPERVEKVLSKKEDRKEGFEELLQRNAMGYKAFLMNLRLMFNQGVNEDLLRDAILKVPRNNKLLPFDFIRAYKENAAFYNELNQAMLQAVEGEKKLPGKTIVLVDVSGSMEHNLSSKSVTSYKDVAVGIAIYANEVCDNTRVFAFGNTTQEVPAVRGLGLLNAFKDICCGGGTELGRALKKVSECNMDRLIVISDEQSADDAVSIWNRLSCERKYMINVAVNKKGVGYGSGVHIDGFSPYVIRFISELEAQEHGR